MNTLNTVCVYCGSSLGGKHSYTTAAKNLAQSLYQQDIGIVYGGASIGIMGVVADEMLKLGGKVIGVIPESLAKKELTHQNLTDLHVTDSMHERKMKMAELADGFIALPGGIGTMEELFEIWTWAQLGFHHKPCGLLNIEGYYDGLIQFLNHMRAEKFVIEQHRDLLIVEDNSEQIIEKFFSYQSPITRRWVDENEI